MLRRILCVAALMLAVSAFGARAQEASDSYEREAKKDFNQGRFKQAAAKFERAAEAASDPSRRARMHLQEAWSHFNAREARDARDALKAAFLPQPDLEVVPDFFSPDFMKLVEEVRAAQRVAAPAPVADVAETIRMARERLRDGQVDEVIHDLTYNVPAEKLGTEGVAILAAAYERKGRFAEAAKVRAAAGIEAPATGSPAAAPAPAVTPAPVANAASVVAPPAVPTPRPAVTTPPPAAQRSGGSPVDYLALGRQALQRGDPMNAMAAANRHLELEPNSSEAYRLLAEVYLLRGERAIAKAHLEQSLKYNEKNEATLLLLYDFYTAEKEWKSALEYLKRATEVNPTNRDRMVALGRKIRADGNLDRAAQVFAAAAEALPNDASVLTEYGAVLLAAGRTDTALEPLMKAVSAAPGREVVHANLAVVLRRKGQLREAEREYREALRADPDYVPALVSLGTLLLQRQSPAEAVEPLKKAATLEPTNAEAVWALARSQRLSGQAKDASDTLEHAVELGTPEIWNEAGIFAIERGRYDEAARLFARAAEKAPDAPLYRTNRDRAAAAARFLKDAGAAPAR